MAEGEIRVRVSASNEIQQAPVDVTLSVSGMAADAKETGDRIQSLGTLIGGSSFPLGEDTVSGAITAVNGRIGSGDMPGETTTVIAALNYVLGYAEAILGDTELPRGAETVSEALDVLSDLIGEGTINSQYTGLINAVNTITALIGDTALPAGSTTITDAISKLVSGYIVLSVNGVLPDVDGNVEIPTIATVNHREPDENGNVNIDTGAMSVNGNTPDAAGDVKISEVDYANNLLSDSVQYSEGEFIERTSGGHASIQEGDAWLNRIYGRRIHTGYVAEYLVPTVYPATRPDPEEGEEPDVIAISAFDKAVFRAYVAASTTIDLYYTTEWSADPTLYGLTITGTPIAGDHIQVVYVKENRGTITQSTPTGFRSTGWNLFNSETGRARVLKYSDTQGFKISGDYDGLSFATTLEGDTTPIVPVDGAFTVPSDGYVFVGSAQSNVAIWMAWGDWSESYPGEYQAYSETEVDLTDIMEDCFPTGLKQVGTTYDTIDYNAMTATKRIERLEYTAANYAEKMAIVGNQEYEIDSQYIYYVLPEPVVTVLDPTEVSGAYTASDHGLEIIDGTSVPVYVETMYGNNLKNKLERDVLTISQQTLTAAQQNQVRANVKAMKCVTVNMGTISSLPVTMTATGVTAKMICVASTFGNPSARTGNWTVTTATDSVTLSGSLATGASTTVMLVLIEQDEITAVSQSAQGEG